MFDGVRAGAADPAKLLRERARACRCRSAVRVRIVRSPHVQPPDSGDDATAWGVTTIVDTTLQTDALGVAHIAIPAPTDGLASTYGVAATSGSSTASANLVAPDARIALAVTPVRPSIRPTRRVRHTRLRRARRRAGRGAERARAHQSRTDGPRRDLTLGARRHGARHVPDVALGMNLVTAQADLDGARGRRFRGHGRPARADRRSGSGSERREDRGRARAAKPSERTGITANLAGAAGDALITMESVRGVTPAVVPTQTARRARRSPFPIRSARWRSASRSCATARSSTRRNRWSSTAPASAAMALTADRTTYAPASTATITIADGDDPTAHARRARERPSRHRRRVVRRYPGRARIGRHDDAEPRLARSAVAHVGRAGEVDGGRHLRLRPAAPNRGPDTIVAAATRVLTWRVDRSSGTTFTWRCRAIRAATCSRSSR